MRRGSPSGCSLRGNTHLRFVSLCLSFSVMPLCLQVKADTVSFCWCDVCGNVPTVHGVPCALLLLCTWHCVAMCSQRLMLLAGAAVHTGFLTFCSSVLPSTDPPSLYLTVALWAILACLSAVQTENSPEHSLTSSRCTCVADSLGECSRRGIAGVR